MELKTLHFGTSTYGSETGRCEAVARRARAIQREYVGKAKTVDMKYCGTASGEVGPVARRLQSFGAVRGLVFGAWGEASRDVELLLSMLARLGAETHWRRSGCRDADEARGTIAWLLRRRWALTALRENARLKLERLEHAGRGAAAAAARRANARGSWSVRDRTRQAIWSGARPGTFTRGWR